MILWLEMAGPAHSEGKYDSFNSIYAKKMAKTTSAKFNRRKNFI
jgi:hypothetical protein